MKHFTDLNKSIDATICSEVPYDRLESSYNTGLESSFDIPDESKSQKYERTEEFVELAENQDLVTDLESISDSCQTITITDESEKNTIHENVCDTMSEIDVEPLVPDNSNKIHESSAEMKRHGTSLSFNDTIENSFDISAGRLIRSNSYTLDDPSPLLLQRMAKEGIVFKPKPSNTAKKSVRKNSLNNLKKPSSTAFQKPKKSPYETKLSGNTPKRKKNQLNMKCQSGKIVKKSPQKIGKSEISCTAKQLSDLEISGISIMTPRKSSVEDYQTQQQPVPAKEMKSAPEKCLEINYEMSKNLRELDEFRKKEQSRSTPLEPKISRASNYSDILIDLSCQDQEQIFQSHPRIEKRQSSNYISSPCTDFNEPVWRDPLTYGSKFNQSSCSLGVLSYGSTDQIKEIFSNRENFHIRGKGSETTLFSTEAESSTLPSRRVSSEKIVPIKSPTLQEFQENCNKKMQSLIQQQQDEYQKMQDKFKHQQQELLKNFCANKLEDLAFNFPESDVKNRTSTPLNFAADKQPSSSDFSHLSDSQTLYLSNTLNTDTEPHQESFLSENFYTCVNKEQLDLDNFLSPRKDRSHINSYMEHIKNNYQIKSGNIQDEIARIQVSLFKL